ncbi:MAG: type II toxin-antitoxin system prevent-host-death family antitoxin [Clostridiales Family XIII bacterium]|nr:type II toxin-antitoxin system prevent-host-death family antitoxin [Clostridiales Family XIII bacterium]
MQVTATELKNNLGKYLAAVDTEDVIVTKNGKNIAKLISLREARVAKAKSLFGIIKADVERDEIRAERLKRYEGNG